MTTTQPEYTAYLRSEHWRRKRDARLALDGYRCRLCDWPDDLEVHHRPRSYRRIPNESINDDLVTLCQTCHELVTDRIRRQRYAVTFVPSLSAVDQTDDSVVISGPLVLPSVAHELWEHGGFRLRARVKIKQNRVVCTRPIFRYWQASVSLEYEDSLLDAEQVVGFATRAGFEVGMGDWRPRYGRFQVEQV